MIQEILKVSVWEEGAGETETIKLRKEAVPPAPQQSWDWGAWTPESGRGWGSGSYRSKGVSEPPHF